MGALDNPLDPKPSHLLRYSYDIARSYRETLQFMAFFLEFLNGHSSYLG